MNSASRVVLRSGAAQPDELASSPAPQCFARNVYYDRTHDIDAAKLLPGEYYVASRDMLIVTVLGSCVAACIRDARTGLGGMNHFMLPDAGAAGSDGSGARYGTFAMEVLINHLLKLGAQREHLEAKVFGGGNVLAGLVQANIGHKNAAFVEAYLKTEQIRIVGRDLADIHPRKVHYFPASGRVLVKKLLNIHNNTIAEREVDYSKRLVQAPVSGDIELFT